MFVFRFLNRFLKTLPDKVSFPFSAFPVLGVDSLVAGSVFLERTAILLLEARARDCCLFGLTLRIPVVWLSGVSCVGHIFAVLIGLGVCIRTKVLRDIN